MEVHNSLGEAPVQEICYCPKTSKDANGFNRNHRHKVAFNVVGSLNPILHSAKALRIEDI